METMRSMNGFHESLVHNKLRHGRKKLMGGSTLLRDAVLLFCQSKETMLNTPGIQLRP